MENLKKIIACFSFVVVLILIFQFYYFLPKYDLYDVIRGQKIVTEDFAKDNDVLYEELRREGVFAAANLTIEKNWIYKNKTILLNFPASISSQRISFSSLSRAQNFCLQLPDCGGITKVKDEYILKEGQIFVHTFNNDQSWRRPEVLYPDENCTKTEGLMIDEDDFLHLQHDGFKQLLENRKCNENGNYEYTGSYGHLNQLVKFSHKTDFELLIEPENCPLKASSNKTLILFAIKSTPNRRLTRDAIRLTWLNKRKWKFQKDIEIHFIFIVGQGEIHEHERQFNDILQIDFEESHYNLSLKDYHLFNYIEEKCQEMDFLFKGDDDILLIPENLMYHINFLRERSDFSMMGCLKENEAPTRVFISKYYTPFQIFPDHVLPHYYSGGGYIMDKFTIDKLIKVKDEVPMLHLDDVWIGQLIEHAGLVERMGQNQNICLGLGVYPGYLLDIFREPCLLAGLTVYHRFQSSTDMKKRFLIMEVVDVEKLCYAAKITHITRRWENTDLKFLIEPFKNVVQNYISIKKSR